MRCNRELLHNYNFIRQASISKSIIPLQFAWNGSIPRSESRDTNLRVPLDSIWGSVTGWPWTRGRPTSTSRDHEYTIAESALKSRLFGSTRLLGHDFAVIWFIRRRRIDCSIIARSKLMHYVESVTLDVYDWYFISALLSSIIQRA